MQVMVTGATGFVGSMLIPSLLAAGYSPKCAVRARAHKCKAPSVEVGEIGATTDWTEALADVQTVIHLAAKAHERSKMAKQSLESYREINGRGTARLAQAAAAAGVRRFIYLSTIKVHGESGNFRVGCEPRAVGPYAIAKLEGERALQDVCASSAMEYVIVRPPLVYGPGAKANFASLERFVRMGLPVPIPATANRRSLLSIYNLTSFVVYCVESLFVRNRVFLLDDGIPVSTKELIEAMCDVLSRPCRTIPLQAWTQIVLRQLPLVGSPVFKLSSDLSIEGNRNFVPDWSPPMSFMEGLRLTLNC